MSSPAAVHLLAGDDDHLLSRALEDLLRDLQGRIADLDVEHVDVATAEHLPEVRTASLFGGTRCVVLRGAEGLSGDLADEVTRYLDDPPPDAVLVLVARGTGRIQSIAKTAAKVGVRIDVEAPAPWADRAWHALVKDEFTRLGRTADVPAVEAIIEHAGLDASIIASKVAQVAAAAPAGPRITAEHVEAVVVGHGNRGGFAIADAVVARQPAEALVALRGALEAGEAPLAILGALTYRFRQLLQVKGRVAKDRFVGRYPTGRMFDRVERDTRNFGPGELAWAHDRIARADLDLKGSDLPAELVLELAVLDLATKRDVGRPWNPLAS